MAPPLLLLVEDCPELAMIVAALARRGGYRMEYRSDVPRAWDYLHANVPDLVLLDWQLPGETGLGLCRRIRGSPVLEELPLALFCHWDLPSQISEALEAGVDFLVSKDLVTRSVDWQRRIAEILPAAHGQMPPRLVGWKVEFRAQPPGDWGAALHSALCHPVLRAVGSQVMFVLLRRALQGCLPGTEVSCAVAPDGRGLRAGVVLRPNELQALVASLAAQAWQLLGTQASEALWPALAAVVPGNPLWLIPSRDRRLSSSLRGTVCDPDRSTP
jgi:CheY-like chemotaxis protein